jgi:hypothetical protein
MLMDPVPEKIRVLVRFHEKTPPVLKSAGFDEDNFRDIKAMEHKWHRLLFS